jgi:hypothetical protein
MMAGFNVGPSQNFQGGVLRRPQPAMGGGGMNPGMNPGMGQNMRMGGGNPGMGMPSPNRYPSPQPMPQPNPGIEVAPSTGANLPPGAMTNGRMGSQGPMGGAQPPVYGGMPPPMAPPAYTPPNANPQNGLFNRYAMMRGNRM